MSSVLVSTSTPAEAEPAATQTAPGDEVEHLDARSGVLQGVPGLRATGLRPGWLDSTDLVVTGASSPRGYALYAGRESEGYAFRSLATIQPAGNDEDEWLGEHCTSEDGRWVLVTVLQRGAINKPVLRDRGAFAFIVSTSTGRITPLVTGVAHKSHAVVCGQGNRAALLRHLGSDQERTELLEVDLATARVVRRQHFEGQLTSPLPLAGRTLALQGGTIVDASTSDIAPLASIPGRAFRLTQSQGRVYVTTQRSAGTEVLRAALTPTSGKLTQFIAPTDGIIAGGSSTPLHELAKQYGRTLGSSRDGFVHVIPGQAGSSANVRRLVTSSGLVVEAKFPDAIAPAETALPPLPLNIAGGGGGRIPGAAIGALTQSTTPTCAVPRNDTRKQVPQPTAKQLDWAVQQAARNALSGANGRPANFLNMGLAAYGPSTDFPMPALSGWPGATVPPAVMNGVLAQENAYRHASRRILPGLSGNPAIGDYYGAAGTLDVINYDDADCGYGAAQVTDGMRVSETIYSANGKTKIGVDYAENVQVGMKILVGKWNQLYAAGILANGGDPKFVENWYMALWAYNSGIQPTAAFGNTTGCTPSPTCTDSAGNWGLGWTNNPANPDYPQNRDGFLRATYADAEHPGDWPYQERVFGWMETPIKDYKGVDSYSRAVPNDTGSRPTLLIPATSTFCTADNNCEYGYISPTNSANKNCKLDSRRCWWHQPITWTAIAGCGQCHTSPYSFATTDPEPVAVNPHLPACNSALPSGTVIVDDIPAPHYNLAGCSSPNWSSSGTFSLTPGTDASGAPLGVIDLHQIGTGFGGHAFFTGNRLAADSSHRVTGVWTPTGLTARTYVIQAHVPNAGANATSANYTIRTAGGGSATKAIDMHLHANRWVSLGAFQLDAASTVTLTNVTTVDTKAGIRTVAYDAMAFVPVAGTFVQQDVDAVAIFDRNTALNTNAPGKFATGKTASMQSTYEWANDLTVRAYQIPTCPPLLATASGCLPAATKDAFFTWMRDVLAAGTRTDATGSTPTIAKWMGFSNTTPSSVTEDPAYQTDDLSYKIRQRVHVTYVKGADGLIVPGSADASYQNRTGSTHIPAFVLDIWAKIAADYNGASGKPNLSAPDVSYDAVDLNVHDHQTRHVDGRTAKSLPGRAYRPAGQQPVVTDDRKCVQTLSTAGGSIGYRPMLGAPAASNSVYAWKESIKQAVSESKVPAILQEFAEDIYEIFYDDSFPIPGVDEGSHYQFAPPIWQELNLRVCVDGKVLPPASYQTGNPFTLFRQSHMPDGYLYLNGKNIDGLGVLTTAVTAAQKGNFGRYTNDPFFHADTGFGRCDTVTFSNGNPWGMSLPSPTDPNVSPNDNPTDVTHCIDRSLPIDPEYS